MMRVLLFALLLAMPLMSHALQGLFMVVKGDVKMAVGDGQPLAVKVGTKINVGDTVVTGEDSRAKIVMSDRNVINISPNTKLVIEEYTNDGRTKNVKLSLLSGKIRNNVEQKYDAKTNKFEVRTPTAVAGVRGTQFITSYDIKSKQTEVITLFGQVELRTINAGLVSKLSVNIAKGEVSRAEAAAAVPKPPEKVPKNTLKEIDRETNVREHESPSNSTGPSAGTSAPGSDSSTDNVKNSLIRGAIEQKYDKTRVHVNPNPTGP